MTEHILVVDDMAANRYITASWLRRGGYRTTEAETGAQALSLLWESSVDLVVLDVNLPDMSGYEVCERIKADPRTKALPVIHMSATAIEPDDRAQGLTRGADAYLTEPVDPDVLIATVTAALRYYRARAVAERLAERLTQLNHATLAINAAATFDELVTSTATGACAIFDSPVTVLIPTTDGRVRMCSLAGPAEPARLRTVAPDLLDRLVGAVLDHGTSAALVPVTGDVWLHPGVAVVARTKAARPAVCVTVSADALSSEADRDLLLQWGQATALATQSLRQYTEEHTLALTLQRSLLPTDLPSHPGLVLATRYVPAAANAEIGGDFYDVTELDGRFLVAIGDVCGHSINAAMIMGEVRHALRAYAVEGHGPVAILDRLDAMLRHFHAGNGFTTLCLLLIDPTSGTATVANAGHVPPLVADEHGTRYLDVAGPLLGVGLPRDEATEVALSPSTTVVLLTDGLVERRGVPLEASLEQLRSAVSHGQDLEELCDALLTRFGRDSADDIALLTLSLVSRPGGYPRA